ncbi:hypothetical protein PRIPAC_80435 [Pristionchus pacificus]|uniref:Uncharacterized protein n=1 Tax=Pristionchus pacificus TaxID=54126 RepID=A0A2A6CM91_PRIPA|nr:hypothetical protein PRIPAC_80435 [Pristionchus pacificus]|eukprot:PDM79173.1 hypothetical protein PRIPAC_31752 [Pristionchus pacificus]
MPSFLVCCTVFVVGAVKIRSKLMSQGASISKRTKHMQLRFFLRQIARPCKLFLTVLLPLILTSFPLGVFSVAALLGWELHNVPVLIAIMMWPLPMQHAYHAYHAMLTVRKGIVLDRPDLPWIRSKISDKADSAELTQSMSQSKNSVSQRNTSTHLTSS